MSLSANHMKRYRAVMLKMLDLNHRNQHPRLDHIQLGLVLRGAGCGVGVYDVLTLLQDLHDRGLVRYDQTFNKLTHDAEITKIEITAAGRDILEETKFDPSVGL